MNNVIKLFWFLPLLISTYEQLSIFHVSLHGIQVKGDKKYGMNNM